MKTMSVGILSAIGFAVTISFCPRIEAASKSDKQDAAFSLLIEAFGEVQSALIENDYQTQLRAAGSMADPASRGHVVELARQEHDLRLGKLRRQLTEMALAYHYSRPTDESDTGVGVREKIDPTTAARSLKGFVLIGAAPAQTDGETNMPESIVEIPRSP